MLIICACIFIGLIMNPIWRVICLSLMAITLIFLTLSTFTTAWREDDESVINVFSTIGLWRICRDIKHGATVDHKCLGELANDAPTWFQCCRAFMLIALIFVLISFILGVRTIVQIPPVKNKNARPHTVSLGLPALLMFVSAIFTMIGVSIFAVATHMEQGLYFPEYQPPTWGNSWSQVMAKRNSIPSELPEDHDMKLKYSYSFAYGWVGCIFGTASFVINLIASGKS